jgi:hypothetical protein
MKLPLSGPEDDYSYDAYGPSPSVAVSPKRKKLEKNFIKKNMYRVIFGGRAPSLPPPPSDNKDHIPLDTS